MRLWFLDPRFSLDGLAARFSRFSGVQDLGVFTVGSHVQVGA